MVNFAAIRFCLCFLCCFGATRGNVKEAEQDSSATGRSADNAAMSVTRRARCG